MIWILIILIYIVGGCISVLLVGDMETASEAHDYVVFWLWPLMWVSVLSMFVGALLILPFYLVSKVLIGLMRKLRK